METLYSYILESATKFDQLTNDWEVLKKNNPQFKVFAVSGAEEEVIKLLNCIGDDDEIVYIYAQGGSIFKINRGYNELIIDAFENKLKDTELTFKLYDGGYIKIKYKGNLVMQTGNGSYGRVSTDQQESGTCMVWNKFVNGEFDINCPEDERNKIVKNYVSSLSDEFDADWIRTFSKHVIAICSYFESIGQDPLKYKLCLSHKASLNEDKIGEIYGDFVKEYVKSYGAKKKDPFDPSDVLAYDKNQVDLIQNLLIKCKSLCKTDPSKAKEMYKAELYDEGLIKGLSLKKITGKGKKSRFDTYNDDTSIAKINRLNDITLDPRCSDKQTVVRVEGKFNFDAATPTDQIVLITLRSFGEKPYMDCTILGGGPTLGKCPVNIWRDIIGAKVSDGLIDACAKFKNFVESTPKRKLFKDFEKLILASIKEGDHCFPFVLIH